MNGIYVQYGCGFSTAEGWLNFDASPTLRFERIPIIGRCYTKNRRRFPIDTMFGDITKGLPIKCGSCSGVYASHVLEHLSFDDFDLALKETHRIMSPGAIFRLVVPDLQLICKTYLEAAVAGKSEACSDFMRQAHLGVQNRPRTFVGLIKASLRNDKHLWMWDEKGLRSKLEENGFVDIRRALFRDCDDPMFEHVENEERFHGSCAMEARRSEKTTEPTIGRK